MGLKLAFKAFCKALKDGPAAEEFLSEASGRKKAPADLSHLRLLALLQRSGRLVDFLQEDISTFKDAQVGAAVRKIHADCRAALDDMVAIKPLFKEKEGDKVTLEAGYDPSEVRVVGNVKGAPPFEGLLRHKGWKAHKLSLPKQTAEVKRDVICPAEIEII